MAIQKALIDQLVRSVGENIRTLVFRTDLTSPAHFVRSVHPNCGPNISRMDLTIGQLEHSIERTE